MTKTIGLPAIASVLGIPAPTMKKQLARGNPDNLPVRKEGGRWVMYQEDLYAWNIEVIDAARMKPDPVRFRWLASHAGRTLRRAAQEVSALDKITDELAQEEARAAYAALAERFEDLAERYGDTVRRWDARKGRGGK